MSTDREQLAKQLWAIGDHVRMNILQQLPVQEDCDHGINVSQLAEKMNLSQPAISHHLRVLRQAGIVKNRKMCRDVYYWIDCAEAESILQALRDVLTSQD